MPNINCADCGFNPQVANKPKAVTAEKITDSDGWDLRGVTNAVVEYASTATAALEIAGFLNMVRGKEYKLIVKNDATTALGITFPNTVVKEKPEVQDAASSNPITIEEADIAAGDIVVYTFWTDGTDVFVSRKLFA